MSTNPSKRIPHSWRGRLLAAIVPLLALVPSGAAVAQIQVLYGDHVSSSITSALQTKTYFLTGTQGDTLRITFTSVNSGWPNYTRLHRLDVRDSSGPIGNPIMGLGVLTTTLPNTGVYVIEVNAINRQSTGWFDFHLDRLNDPNGADRMALDWELHGDITAAAEFAVYTLRAEAGSTAQLNLACVTSGWPNHTPSCTQNCSIRRLVRPWRPSTAATRTR